MNKHLISAALVCCISWVAWSAPAAADPIYVEVGAAPRYIEESPSTVYEGRPVYYHEGRWYHRRGSHWAYYREEPRPLIEFRASPAYHHHRWHHHHRR